MIKTREISSLRADWEPNLEDTLCCLGVAYVEETTDQGTNLIVDFTDIKKCLNRYASDQRNHVKFLMDLVLMILDNREFDQVTFESP
jgi:hypothetical protein